MSPSNHERRKSPRYNILLNVYFPEFDLHGYAANISLDGCFIKTENIISEGFLTDILMELPIIGVIAMKGYVQHKGKNDTGIGLEFVQVRFEHDQSEYFTIYSQFVKALPHFGKIRNNYLQLINDGRIKPLEIPVVKQP